MLCCGINSFIDLKQYFKQYLRLFDEPEILSVTCRVPETDNEWENISTPRGQ